MSYEENDKSTTQMGGEQTEKSKTFFWVEKFFCLFSTNDITLHSN